MDNKENSNIFVFRVDASIQMGNGHVMRCLTLADALTEKSGECYFICRQHLGNLISFIRDKGYTVFSLDSPKEVRHTAVEVRGIDHAGWLGALQSDDAQESINAIQLIESLENIDWLIVDHYSLDYCWHQELREHTHKLMVVDDLADRQHDCDLLLDQTYGRSEQDYRSLVPEPCEILTGSQYALLRPEFAKWREYSINRRRNPELKHLLITMGGVDKDNTTSNILTAIADSILPLDCQITVVMGANAPWIDCVKKQAESLKWNVEIKVNVENMAQLMSDSDLCIGAAGSTTWERCCLGVPTIIFVLAENQKFSASILLNKKIIRLVDNVKTLQTEILKIVNNHGILADLSTKSSLISDGSGAKVTVEILSTRKMLEVN